MKHMQSQHQRGEGRAEEGAPARRRAQHACTVCGATYRKLPTLLLHMREDHADRDEVEEAKTVNEEDTTLEETVTGEEVKNETTGINAIQEVVDAMTTSLSKPSNESISDDDEEDKEEEAEEADPASLCGFCGVDMVLPEELRRHMELRHPGMVAPGAVAPDLGEAEDEVNFNDFAQEVNGDEDVATPTDEQGDWDEDASAKNIDDVESMNSSQGIEEGENVVKEIVTELLAGISEDENIEMKASETESEDEIQEENGSGQEDTEAREPSHKKERPGSAKMTRRQMKRTYVQEDTYELSDDEKEIKKPKLDDAKSTMKKPKLVRDSVGGGGATGFVCVECGVECKDRSHLRNHLLAHFYNKFDPFLPADRPFACPECGHTNRDRITLIRHFAWTHHKLEEVTGLSEESLRPRAVGRPAAHESHVSIEGEAIVMDDLSFDVLEALENVDKTGGRRKRGRPSKVEEDIVEIDCDDETDPDYMIQSARKVKVLKAGSRISLVPSATPTVLTSLPRSTKVLFTPAAGDCRVPQGKKLLCSLCRKDFSSRSDFDSHVKTDHRRGAAPDSRPEPPRPAAMARREPESWACDHCNVKCASSKALQGHTKTEHSFKCKQAKCKLVFAVKEKLDGHMRSEHMYQCGKCPSIFEHKLLLEKHIKSSHHFKCDSCPEVCDSPKALSEHAEARHRGCETCEDEFNWPEAGHSCYYTRRAIRPLLV
jgi:hypothetical protein